MRWHKPLKNQRAKPLPWLNERSKIMLAQETKSQQPPPQWSTANISPLADKKPRFKAVNTEQLRTRIQQMSVIAALCSSKTRSTWIASDTMVCSGNLRQFIGPKWIIREAWAVGVAGHLRTINVFQGHADALLADLADEYEFARRARELLKADGYGGTNESDGPVNFGQMIMLARADAVWAVGADFSVMRLPIDELWAEGSGRDLAIGAAHALLSPHGELLHEEVVRQAIETAIKFDSACGGRLWMEEMSR